jgi:precorrin-6Y C5,15-methyltransferase (decarboxylating)
MSRPVVVVGISGADVERLTPAAREAIRQATFLAGGRRHLELVARPEVERFTITNNVGLLLDRLAGRRETEQCVVLASGDPLLFGIGHRIVESLGREHVLIEPALSSLQLAFARVGLPWHDVRIASVHGRPLKETLLPLLGAPKLALLTGDGVGPSEIARFFLDRGLEDYDGWVCERLGMVREAVIAASLPELAARRFDALNVVLLVRRTGAAAVPDALLDSQFARPPSGPVMLTHNDVRALVLRRFHSLPSGPIWDIGAGLGGVAVALSRAFPGREIVAIERSDERLVFLRENRGRLGAYNMRIVPGEAPQCIVGEEESPAGIFLGGSGGRLGPILSLARSRLTPGGVLVADFIGLENLVDCLGHVKRWNWPHEVVQVQIDRGGTLGGLSTFFPERAVSIVSARRPRSEEEPAEQEARSEH